MAASLTLLYSASWQGYYDTEAAELFQEFPSQINSVPVDQQLVKV
jgi:hypothetical protein